jgi:hypothetical protein
MVSIDPIASVHRGVRFPVRWIDVVVRSEDVFNPSRAQVVIGWAMSSSSDIFRGAWPLKIWFGVLKNSTPTNHADFKVIVNLNRHISTARGAQPEIFINEGSSFMFRLRPRSTIDRGCFGIEQVELAFAEVAKRSGTGWIRAFRKHGISIDQFTSLLSRPPAIYQAIRPEREGKRLDDADSSPAKSSRSTFSGDCCLFHSQAA